MRQFVTQDILGLARVGAEHDRTRRRHRNPGAPQWRPTLGKPLHRGFIRHDNQADGTGVALAKAGPGAGPIRFLGQLERERHLRRPRHDRDLPDLG